MLCGSFRRKTPRTGDEYKLITEADKQKERIVKIERVDEEKDFKKCNEINKIKCRISDENELNRINDEQKCIERNKEERVSESREKCVDSSYEKNVGEDNSVKKCANQKLEQVRNVNKIDNSYFRSSLKNSRYQVLNPSRLSSISESVYGSESSEGCGAELQVGDRVLRCEADHRVPGTVPRRLVRTASLRPPNIPTPYVLRVLQNAGLDSVSSTGVLRNLGSDIAAPRIDSYRFSMANLEESQDVDLDAILGELCALETQYDREIDRAAQNKRASADQRQHQVQHQSRTHTRTSSEGNRGLKLDPGESDSLAGKADGSVRTDSPDNDSAFSDTVSMLSSESSASSGASGVKSAHHLQLHLGQQQDPAGKAKAEKIRMALEKMREASVKKLFIKAFTVDGSTKSLLVDEKMSCGYVTRLLADKNHVQMDPKWAIVEHIPELYMERVYEDHELLVENLMLWTRDSKNRLLFVERPEKTRLFTQPERFLLMQGDIRTGGPDQDHDEHSRNMLLEEFFSQSTNSIPQVEGPLYLKSDSKKGWKKYQFVLRASGLYYFPKEKLKTPRDLVCLAKFDVNQVYYGVGWKKKYKAPTDYCFAIKHPVMQDPKSSKYIKFLCAEDGSSLDRWMVGMRVAKHGRQLMDNYRLLMDELAQEDLDKLAHARSCSVSSIAIPAAGSVSAVTTPSSHYGMVGTTAGSDISAGRHSRASSSSSSGCMSDGAPSSCENAFDSEFPMGTIKRKPSMKPSLPLTSITRQLKEVGETRDSECDSASPVTCSSPVAYTNTGTLTRRHSRRKSSSTDDGSSSGTLKRNGSRSGASTPLGGGTPVRERASPLAERSPAPSPVHSPLHSVPPSLVTAMPSCMTDSITSLPPLPDSTGEITETDSCYPLPPPPPEMFRSTLSLDSLPPPPPPGELPVYAATTDLGGSQLSLMSLPPPPPHSPPTSDTGTIRRRNHNTVVSPDRTPTQPLSPDATPTHSRLNTPCFSPPPLDTGSNCSTPTPTCSPPPSSYSPVPCAAQPTVPAASNGRPVSPPPYVNPPPYRPQSSNTLPPGATTAFNNTGVLRSSLRQAPSQSLPRQNSTPGYSVPGYLGELQVKGSPGTARKAVNFQDPPTSPKKSKKISFNLTPQEVPAPALPKKPQPPKRSDTTRLTSPKKLANSNSAPPTDFLKDLQRVMRKKWQVAQKCKLEPSTTPHEVLGFRDPPPHMADYRETNVSNWVQEHYGHNNFYENVYRGQTPDMVVEYATSPVHMPARPESVHSKSEQLRAKRPPPPPPKRSETTHLSTSGKLH